MSTVKISQLSEITHLNTNTANTLIVGVDIPSGVTGKITATTLAHGLYSHNPLNVGNNEILFPDTVGQFSGNSSNYLQVNLQNFDANGTADYIVTADLGNDVTSYIDMGITNSEYSNTNPFNSLGTAIEQLSGYLYVKGNTAGGNLVIGVTDPNREIRFISGGIDKENVIYTISNTGIILNNNSNIKFKDSSQQDTAAAPANYTQSAFDKANTVNTYAYSANTWLQANTGSALAAAKVYTDTANTYIQSKYLANNSGALFNGVLNIGDKLNVNGSVILANTNFSATQAAFTIAACPIGDIQTPSNDGYMIHISGKQNVASRLVIDSFGANTYGLLAGRTARGTPTAPQAVANNDILLRMSGNGYGSTQFAPLGIARIDIVASETYTDATRGSRIEFWNIPNGSNTLNRIATFNGESVEFTGHVEPKKGFVLTPNVISGSTTTLNIDIANNSLYKCSSTGGLTVNLSGFQFGKVVELWFVNTAGSTQTVTHGCYSNNSTINSTSFSMPASSSAYLRYFSINGDLANTYVSIQHA
jgi:hypothetical protein